MSKSEFNVFLNGLKELYGNDKLPKMSELSMTVWYEALKDLEFEILKKALVLHVKTSRFAPTVADLREKCGEVIAEMPQSKWQ